MAETKRRRKANAQQPAVAPAEEIRTNTDTGDEPAAVRAAQSEPNPPAVQIQRVAGTVYTTPDQSHYMLYDGQAWYRVDSDTYWQIVEAAMRAASLLFQRQAMTAWRRIAGETIQRIGEPIHETEAQALQVEEVEQLWR